MNAILFNGFVSGILSFSLVYIVKNAIDGWLNSKDKPIDFWYRNSVFRALAVIFGSTTGAFLMASPLNGLLVGACGGCLNTVIVSVAKKYIKKLADKK